uniref:Uncharacterized protein n=2 Tax=Araneus ventricosus TaxID=182803 RepID=A0A4Y2BJ84_ARAVE|nr:hypothetical protein AVEN_223921-1 [Araneus ventricosus]GBL91425.1 hypothetical protein AVEN_107315-1 [Araneus ventricosus]
MSNFQQMIRNDGIQKNLKSNTQSAYSNFRPRCGSGKAKICLHFHLASSLEMKLEIPRVEEEESGWQEFWDFEPCLKPNFGTSVNALPNFSSKMDKKNRS